MPLMGRCLAPGLALAMIILLAPHAPGQTPGLTLTLHGQGQGCPEDARFCYTIQEGDLADLRPGSTVSLTFENNDTTVHNVYVAPLDEGDPNRAATHPENAIASTADLAPGQQDRITFTAPEDASGLYIWCDIGAHEAQGMHLEAPYDPSTWEPPEPRSTPIPLLASILFMLLAGSLLARPTPPERDGNPKTAE